jgi:hypothetical protein
MTENKIQFLRKRRKRLRAPQDVIQEMQARHQQGVDLLDIEKQDRRLLNAAWRCFGGWQEALVGAGVVAADSTFRDTQRWWRQRVIDWIRRLQEKGRSLDAQKPGNRAVVKAALTYFENWPAALAAAKVSVESNERAPNAMDETRGDGD